MASTDRTPAAKRVPMDSMRKTALVAGVLYVITFLASIPAVFLLGPVLTDPNYITSAGADTQVMLGAALDLVTALAGIGTAIALFSVVRRQHEGLALGFVTTRLVEGAVIVIGVMSILAVVTLRQPGATGVEATSLAITGHALVAVRDWTFIVGPTLMAGLNALMLAPLMYRSGLVPRVIPAAGLVGGPLLIASTIGILLGVNELGTVWAGLATAPIFFWELSLGLWMTFKGFRKDAPLMVAAAAEAASPERPAGVARASVGIATNAGAASAS
jgi:hypothetical protein